MDMSSRWKPHPSPDFAGLTGPSGAAAQLGLKGHNFDCQNEEARDLATSGASGDGWAEPEARAGQAVATHP